MALRGARTVLPLRERGASRLRGRREDKNTVFQNQMAVKLSLVKAVKSYPDAND
jgi:hypothetical protein